MRTHGKRSSRAYRAWNQMRQRCTNPNNTWFHRYGERGISVDAKWNTFEGFFADMGECPAGLTLERKNNDLGYNKSNCEWATWKSQARNRSTCVLVEYMGSTRTMKEWAELVGLNYFTFRTRLLSGWPIELALNSPLSYGHKPKDIR